MRLDQRGIQARQEQLGRRGIKVTPALRVFREIKAHRAILDRWVQRETLALRVPMDITELMESLPMK